MEAIAGTRGRAAGAGSAEPDRPTGAGPDATARPRGPVSEVAVGIAFSCYWQLTGDSGADADLGAFKGRQFGLGPQVRAVVNFGEKPVTFQLRFLKEFAVQNRPEGMATWFITSLKL
jgi:hypothetical protein